MNGMSDNVYAHDSKVATDFLAAGDGNMFQRVMQMRDAGQVRDVQNEASTGLSSEEERMSLFQTVRPNIVQSIRAFRVQDLADEANQLGQHFLYAYCANAQSKQEVLETIATSFLFPKHFGKNYDALYDCLTDLPLQKGHRYAIHLDKLERNAAGDAVHAVFADAREHWAEAGITLAISRD